MKKILLGSTTLIGAAVLFAGAASADTPKVTVGGFADFQMGVVNEDLDSTKRSQAFRSDTEVTFRIDAKTDGGLGYGGGVDVETDASADADTQGTNASRTFIYLDGDWGRAEAGSEVGAQGTMKVGAESIARATGGIDGDWTYFFSTSPTPAAANQVLATPDLYLAYGGGAPGAVQFGDESQDNVNKVTYYTPRFSGFQLGVSYAPDSTSRGQTVNRFDDGVTGVGGVVNAAENIWAGALNYDNKFGDIGFTAAGTVEWGNATLAANEDLRAWNLGAKLAYMGFSLAGSYGDLGESLRTKTLNADDTHYWTVGAAYEYGPFAGSVTYLDSEYDRGNVLTGRNEFTNLAVGVDYKMAPGFTPYAEVNFIEMDIAGGVADDNDGTVFIVGSQLNF